LWSRSVRSSAEKVSAKMRRPATGARAVQNERKAGGARGGEGELFSTRSVEERIMRFGVVN
jgi:hypothetical protein